MVTGLEKGLGISSGKQREMGLLTATPKVIRTGLEMDLLKSLWMGRLKGLEKDLLICSVKERLKGLDLGKERLMD